MRILGVDPGTAIVGIGLIDLAGSQYKIVDFGCIRTSAKDSDAERLHQIFISMQGIINDFKPHCLAVEQLFFNKNTKTALSVGQARGVILLSGREQNLPVFEYTPLQVKQAIVGYGRAEKRQVQEMVKVLLKLEERPTPDDAADALAVAICHAHSRNLQELFSK
ncbi:MAG: crossover junction endodeoxyribonuclease RuvC [Bacillota bacterium]